MASTALQSEEEKKEYFDSPEVLDKKVQQLADWIKASRHFTMFTGAGISTAAGIPDYRSGADTVNKTGAGCWEVAADLEKKGESVDPNKKLSIFDKDFEKIIYQAMPSQTHMAMVAL